MNSPPLEDDFDAQEAGVDIHEDGRREGKLLPAFYKQTETVGSML